MVGIHQLPLGVHCGCGAGAMASAEALTGSEQALPPHLQPQARLRQVSVAASEICAWDKAVATRSQPSLLRTRATHLLRLWDAAQAACLCRLRWLLQSCLPASHLC